MNIHECPYCYKKLSEENAQVCHKCGSSIAKNTFDEITSDKDSDNSFLNTCDSDKIPNQNNYDNTASSDNKHRKNIKMLKIAFSLAIISFLLTNVIGLIIFVSTPEHTIATILYGLGLAIGLVALFSSIGNIKTHKALAIATIIISAIAIIGGSVNFFIGCIACTLS